MKKPPPLLTPRIIADMRSGDECADPDYAGLRVRRTNAARVFFYRYRASDSALREIKLGEFGPMTLAEARKALGRLKLERERGVDPQLQKQQIRTEARRKREAELATFIRWLPRTQFLQPYCTRCAGLGAVHGLSLGRGGRCALARYRS